MVKRIIGILALVAVIVIIVMAVRERPAVVESEDAIMDMMGYDTLQVSGADTSFTPDSVSVGAGLQADSLVNAAAGNTVME